MYLFTSLKTFFYFNAPICTFMYLMFVYALYHTFMYIIHFCDLFCKKFLLFQNYFLRTQVLGIYPLKVAELEMKWLWEKITLRLKLEKNYLDIHKGNNYLGDPVLLSTLKKWIFKSFFVPLLYIIYFVVLLCTFMSFN